MTRSKDLIYETEMVLLTANMKPSSCWWRSTTEPRVLMRAPQRWGCFLGLRKLGFGRHCGDSDLNPLTSLKYSLHPGLGEYSNDWMQTKRSQNMPPQNMPKCVSLAYGLFSAKDLWELADSGKALKTGHSLPFVKEISLCKDAFLSHARKRTLNNSYDGENQL